MGWDEDRALDSETEYVRMFNQFFTRGSMTATYKAIFLRCLLDLGKYEVNGSNNHLPGSEWVEVDEETVTLDLNFIAARFIKYYWDMDHSFRLRQTTNPNAKILRIIRERRKAGNFINPPNLHTLVSSSSIPIRQETITTVIIKQVLNYLHMPCLLHLLPNSNKIQLNTNTIPFLKKHRVIIRNGLNYKLAIKLERLNKNVPRISAKIDEEIRPPRTLPAKAKLVIDGEQQQKCFYCDVPYSMQKPHIDHVIPFNYVFSTDTYNCVAACIRCNLKKHDHLPYDTWFTAVKRRNDRFKDSLSKFPDTVKRDFVDYDSSWYQRTYDSCRAEYHGNAPFFRP